jgi:AcrR family transcriptional regulator
MSGKKGPVVDRRVQKTRQALHQALIVLILKKGYDAVTIKDIIEAANVGRSTFYAHYSDKDQLLQGGLADLRKLLLAHQKTAADACGLKRIGFSPALFEHAANYRNVYRAMIGKRAGTVVLNRMRALLTDLVNAELALRPLSGPAKELPRTAVVDYVVGALLSVLTWWVDEKVSIPATEADAIFRRLALVSVD